MNQQDRGSAADTDLSKREPLPLIRASELGQYSFCHRAWWLTVIHKIPDQNQTSLQRGRTVHMGHEATVRATVRWRKGGFLLMSMGGLIFFIALLLWLWLGGG